MSRQDHIERTESEDDYDEFESDIDANIFDIRGALSSPTVVTYTAEDLHIMIHEGEVDLDPPYQREVVWNSAKQMAIIDSLYHNYWVPPVVFAVMYDEEAGEESRLCVDGKQRLTSIQKFFDGQIASDRDPDTRELWWYTASAATKASGRAVIPDEFKRKFAQLKITCVEYQNLTPAAEREVFQRVQLGVSLTTAEKLQAISSVRAHWVNNLDNRYVSIENGLADIIDFDQTRGRKFQNLAHMVYCCDGIPDERVPTPGKVEKWLSDGKDFLNTFKTRVVDVLTKIWRMASDVQYNHGFVMKPKVAPIEFVYIGVLLFVMIDDFTVSEQADAVLALRQDIRKKHADIRTNARVGADCWKIIDRLSKGVANTTASGGRKGSKRKAAVDEEWRPSRPQRVKRRPKGRD
ncbi:hypothetical protein BV25DRAFT_209730 [Artomyces pyxidatus]|uniref:Uncharacterized protein n=1 Tax=Artomyces pyxidatus TaxID=48021 RepID=A0ACB8T851_9AGAM|nr:hypothetical protein BV25DRAFT_209730 [Artomyces pyxidatus]